MTMIERERPTRPPERQEPERPVFVTDGDGRARRLRRVGLVGAALAFLWLAGLGVGMLGFGRLPGVRVPGLGKLGGDGASQEGPASRPVQPGSRAPAAGADAEPGQRPTAGQRALLRPPARRRGASDRGAAPRVPPGLVPPPVTAASKQTGWARKGWTVPPGQ